MNSLFTKNNVINILNNEYENCAKIQYLRTSSCALCLRGRRLLPHTVHSARVHSNVMCDDDTHSTMEQCEMGLRGGKVRYLVMRGQRVAFLSCGDLCSSYVRITLQQFRVHSSTSLWICITQKTNRKTKMTKRKSNGCPSIEDPRLELLSRDVYIE